MALSEKQMRRAYQNYLERYTKQKLKMEARGTSMRSRIMNYGSYKMTRTAYLADERVMRIDATGKTKAININQTIVADQQYEFSLMEARNIRSEGKKLGLDFGDSIAKIRGGRDIRNEELSQINDALKGKYPKMSGKDRAKYITEYIFGGDSK